MANVLVLMELSARTILPVSLEALGQGRRVATALGATLYALLPLPEAPAYGEDDLLSVCARHGADKVVLLTDERLSSEAEMRHGTHGRAILAACEQIPPVVLLLGSTPAARDLGPRLAARFGAAYLSDGWIAAEGGQLLLRDKAGRPVLDDEDGPDHVIVCTVPPGRYEASRGTDEAEMVIVATPGGPEGFVEIGHQPEHAWQLSRQDAPCIQRAPAPTLAIFVAVPARPAAGALRVALGQGADKDGGAHYALLTDDPNGALLALYAAAGLEAP